MYAKDTNVRTADLCLASAVGSNRPCLYHESFELRDDASVNLTRVWSVMLVLRESPASLLLECDGVSLGVREFIYIPAFKLSVGSVSIDVRE